MAAITRSAPRPRPAAPARPQLRLVVGGAHPSPRPRPLHPSVYRRRRTVALLPLVTVVAVASTLVSALTGPRGADAHGAAVGVGGDAGPATYVVRHGDSLWSVARDLQPSGDVRPLVDALADANGGPVVRPGDVLVLP